MTHPSFWFSQLATVPIREKLEKNIEADVVIVGGGFTGLWSAYYLKKSAPELSIVLIEKEFVGFGASGRNGGWCSALFPTNLEKLAAISNRQSAINLYLEMFNTLDEIEKILKHEDIKADWQRGGSITLARSELQKNRAQQEINYYRSWGFDESYLKILSQNEASDSISATRVYGGTFTPYCAVIDPAKLVRGLAESVEKLGVKIYEKSPAIEIGPQVIKGSNFKITGKYIIKALEGYNPTIKKYKRDLIPVYSLMIATEPLAKNVLQGLKLQNRETFSDYRNAIIYGQITSDGRIAFGGRGAPYHFGSRIDSKFDVHKKTHKALEKSLKDIFPILQNTEITHKWGGPLAIRRNWSAHVEFDFKSGIATAGGYVGDGVATSNLAGRTLTDLILGNKTNLTQLPWVNFPSKKWEVEPVRFIAINIGNLLAKASDRYEKSKSKESYFSKTLDRLLNK
jgi:glycine/D-amino acid oxidase-like deaminating enzyme